MTEQLSSTPEHKPSPEGTRFDSDTIVDMHASALGTIEAGLRQADAAREGAFEKVVIPGHEQIAAFSLKMALMRREEASNAK